jgi:hypothetical protein
MVAVNIVGDSGMSVSAGFISSSLPSAPSQPIKLSSTDIPSVTISWTAPNYDGGTSIK